MTRMTICQYCNAVGTLEIEDEVPFEMSTKLLKLFTCDPCADAKAKKQKDEAQLKIMADRRERWQAICPEVYRTFDPSLCQNVEMSDRIANWEPKDGMGMIVIGPSRSGKTRAIYRMMERYYMEGKRVFIARGTQWTNLAIDAARGDVNARRKIDAAHNADITAIDDFAKNAWTERSEGEFWDLIEDRGSKMKPVILTCTETGDALMSRMGHTATDILKRIKEYCEPIIWKQQ